jgi:predicted 2-oxoglutarate/Fe(II)-dependent dioxygenase YbiX
MNVHEIDEGVFTISDVLTPEQCRELIAATEAIGYETAPITTALGFVHRPDIRNNTRVIVDDVERAGALWESVRGEIPRFLRGRQAIGLNERFRFYRYDPGERFAPHRDGSYRRPNGEESRLTFMVYLNEGFGGGETKFGETSVTPTQGMALVFEHQLLHEGAAVTAGRKYVLRTDVMYGPASPIADCPKKSMDSVPRLREAIETERAPGST